MISRSFHESSRRKLVRSLPRKQSPAKSWSDGVVQLNQNNCGNAVVRVEKAEGGAAGVEGLRDHYAADDGRVNFLRDPFFEQLRAPGVAPTPVEREPK